jgi:hypothetical protein
MRTQSNYNYYKEQLQAAQVEVLAQAQVVHTRVPSEVPSNNHATVPRDEEHIQVKSLHHESDARASASFHTL